MYALGQPIPLSVQVADSSGDPADGGTVTLTIYLPDGTTATPTVPTPSPTGVYTVIYTPATAGTYGVRWVVTGTNASAPPPDSFTVYPALTIPLVSLADVKAHMNGAVAVSDAELSDMILSVSAAVETYTGVAFTGRTVTETHQVECQPALSLRVSPVQSITSVTVEGAAYTGYTLDAASGLLYYSEDGTGVWDDTVVVTYRAGMTGVPADVRLFVLRAVEGMWQRSQQAPHSALGVGGGLDEWTPTPPSLLPHADRYLLDPYRRLALA